MSRPLLPPRGIFVGTRILFNRAIPTPMKETLLQLMALAWRNKTRTTPVISLPELEKLTGKDARTLRGHLAHLRNPFTALRLQYTGTGQFIIVLAEWLYNNKAPMPEWLAEGCVSRGRNLPRHDHIEKINHQNKENDSLIFNFHDHRARESSRGDPPEDAPPGEEALFSESGLAEDGPGDESLGWSNENVVFAETEGFADDEDLDENLEGFDDDFDEAYDEDGGDQQPTGGRTLSEALQVRLREAGVYAFLMDEVARSDYSEEELEALLRWCENDQPGRSGGMFMVMLRKGTRAPAIYRQPPCPRCGLVGKHAHECPHRYALPD
ncbi:MAG: hypothetical protein GX491_00160 [Chloroflexi bacterium]|nr:hypothetical protein [Chloroflexota bacterium]